MKITIIYDNTSIRKDLRPDWGFSAVVETKDRKILFDTGASGTILHSNMQKLGINPREIQDVFISHNHFDHIGGLSSFIEQNNNVKLWIPPSFRGVKSIKEIVKMKDPGKLYEGIYSTGELEGIEQSLCIKTEKGIMIIAGCSHPKMEYILQVASQFDRIYGILGGLHGNRPESLKGLDFICPTHCSQYKSEIKALYPEIYVEGGVGRIIEVD